MKKKIALAGVILADIIKRIDWYPEKGMLAKIKEIIPSVGGCVPNTGITLKTLAPEEVDVSAIVRIGRDGNGKYVRSVLQKHGLDLKRLKEDESLPTSFTDVMTLPNGERTFFTAAGANAAFCEDDIDVESLDCDIFHIGYLLLLEKLDAPDEKYGTKMARLLDRVQQKGIKTSIDVVSAEGDLFRKIVGPALRYCDYVVVNEIEAAKISGIPLRNGEKLITENLRGACEKLLEAGVRDTVAVHCPELGCSLTKSGKFTVVPSLKLPEGYITGAVGAGDAFCAGMLYAFLFGLDEQEALRLASCVAACNLHAADSIGGAKNLKETWSLEDKFGRKEIKA